MPASRGGRLRKKGCSLVRRTQRQATAAWRLLYRLLFMVRRGPDKQVRCWDAAFGVPLVGKKAISRHWRC